MATHTIQVRVYYEDTDAGGVVYYGGYLKFAERGRTELLRNLGFENSLLTSTEGMIFVVRRVVADYLKPGRLDDLLTVLTTVTKMGGTSLEMDQSVFCHNEVLCSMKVTLVCVGRESLRPVRLPEKVRGAFSEFMSQKAGGGR
ncbi:MAG: tol-pal system-associated acyl-CoA thioesterase [Rhodospirillales bacterium]|nr:tol-pal system-associated acyl-CoA thioesterase [Rhodospirillales bacterium]